MYVNYEMMLRHAEHDLEQAEDELRQFRANTSLSMSGKVRKETMRGMESYKNVLKQRVKNLKEEMRA